MRFVVVQNTGFMPYFLYTIEGDEHRWLARRDLAKTFTRTEAARIKDRLNARNHAAPIPVRIEPVKG